jgi:glycerol-3-phosphate responsive antiterminator
MDAPINTQHSNKETTENNRSMENYNNYEDIIHSIQLNNHDLNDINDVSNLLSEQSLYLNYNIDSLYEESIEYKYTNNNANLIDTYLSYIQNDDHNNIDLNILIISTQNLLNYIGENTSLNGKISTLINQLMDNVIMRIHKILNLLIYDSISISNVIDFIKNDIDDEQITILDDRLKDLKRQVNENLTKLDLDITDYPFLKSII